MDLCLLPSPVGLTLKQYPSAFNFTSPREHCSFQVHDPISGSSSSRVYRPSLGQTTGGGLHRAVEFTMTDRVHLTSLPLELIQKIASLCPLSDVLALCHSCRELYSICSHEFVMQESLINTVSSPSFSVAMFGMLIALSDQRCHLQRCSGKGRTAEVICRSGSLQDHLGSSCHSRI